jgi:hypothetical protein
LYSRLRPRRGAASEAGTSVRRPALLRVSAARARAWPVSRRRVANRSPRSRHPGAAVSFGPCGSRARSRRCGRRSAAIGSARRRFARPVGRGCRACPHSPGRISRQRRSRRRQPRRGPPSHGSEAPPTGAEGAVLRGGPQLRGGASTSADDGLEMMRASSGVQELDPRRENARFAGRTLILRRSRPPAPESG